MPKDKSLSHEKVLMAAREEFTEYGFQKASMRRIGKRCDMSAAGLYRHCVDKEDLFSQLVDPSIDKIDEWMKEHIQRNTSTIENNRMDIWKDSQVDMMRELIYPNMEEYRLLFCKAQGSKYENFLHDLIETAQKKMLEAIPLLRQNGYVQRNINERELHLLLSGYITTMFEPIIHGYTKEEAYNCLAAIEEFYLPGWKQLLGI